MNNYKRISDSIEDLSGGKVIRKKQNIVIPVICIIGGLILMWWGISKWTHIGYEQTSYILVSGGLFLVGWGIVMLTFNNHYYIVCETNERIKPQQIYLDPNQKDMILQLLKSGDLESVLQRGILKKTPLVLEVWKANGHHLLYSQLLYHGNNHSQPLTDPLITEKKG